MTKQLLIILLFPFFLFSQSNSDCDYKKQFDSGDIYEGCRDVEGRFNGKGKYTWADGRYYSGDWVNNKREGSGEFKFSDGSLYKGDWVNNKRDGKGKYTTTDGNIYEGYYKDKLKVHKENAAFNEKLYNKYRDKFEIAKQDLKFHEERANEYRNTVNDVTVIIDGHKYKLQ